VHLLLLASGCWKPVFLQQVQFIVGLEIICRKENNKEEIDYFESMMKKLGYFLNK